MSSIEDTDIVTPPQWEYSIPGEKSASRLTEEEEARNEQIWMMELPLITRAAKRIARADWEDVAQEAFIIFRGRNRHVTPYPGLIGKYLLEAARNLKIWRTNEEYIEYHKTETIFNGSEISEAVAQLSFHYREVLRLRYWEGKTGAEVARTLGISPGEAYRYEYDTYPVLRRLLANYRPLDSDFGPMFRKRL